AGPRAPAPPVRGPANPAPSRAPDSRKSLRRAAGSRRRSRAVVLALHDIEDLAHPIQARQLWGELDRRREPWLAALFRLPAMPRDDPADGFGFFTLDQPERPGREVERVLVVRRGGARDAVAPPVRKGQFPAGGKLQLDAA